MKKLLAAVVVVLAASAVAVGVASGSGGGGKLVDEGFPCTILDGNGSAIAATSSELILYASKAVLRCSGDGAAAASLTYFNYGNTGLTCGSAYGSTTDWSDKVGRNGNSQLTCTFDLVPTASSSARGAGLG